MDATLQDFLFSSHSVFKRSTIIVIRSMIDATPWESLRSSLQVSSVLPSLLLLSLRSSLNFPNFKDATLSEFLYHHQCRIATFQDLLFNSLFFNALTALALQHLEAGETLCPSELEIWEQRCSFIWRCFNGDCGTRTAENFYGSSRQKLWSNSTCRWN